MNSVTNRTRFAEKWYMDKLKKVKKETRLGTKNMKNKTKNSEKMKIVKSTIVNYKKTTKLQKKRYELNKGRTLI